MSQYRRTTLQCPSPGIGYITMYMSFPRYWLHHDVLVLPQVLATSRCTCPSPGIGYITMYMSFPGYWLHHDVHVLPQVLATSRCTCPSPGIGYITMYMSFPRYWLHHDVHVLPQVLATSRCTCPSPGIGYITMYMSFPRYWLHHDVHVLPQVLATSRCTCPSPGIGYITMYMSFPRYWIHHDVHVLPRVLATSRCTCPSPGIGYITMYMASTVVVQQYFDKRRSTASGLNMFGMSLGIFLLPPLIRLSISYYGWQGALFMLGGIVMQAVLCGALLRPVHQPDVQEDIAQEKQEYEASLDASEKRTSFCKSYFPCVMYVFGDCLLQCGHRVTYMYTPLRCDLVGVSKMHAAWLLTIIGIVGCFMRPLAGWIGDLKFVNRAIMLGLNGALSGLTAIITTQLGLFHQLVPLAVLFGIFDCK